MHKFSGFSLIELVIVLAIFAVLCSAVFGVLSNSKKSWESASFQIQRQEEARKAVDKIAWELVSSSPFWEINTTVYGITINSAGDRLDFYLPLINSTTREVTSLRAVRYYVGGLNNAQLLRREASVSPEVVANNIDNVAGQKPFFSFNNLEATLIDLKIPIIRDDKTFVLESQVNLRNRQNSLNPDTEVEEIIEEEEEL